jgi:hypothetical protein
MRYDDNRLDVRGEAAVTVSRLLPSTRLATTPSHASQEDTNAVVEIEDPGALLALLPEDPKPTRPKKKVTAKWFTDKE